MALGVLHFLGDCLETSLHPLLQEATLQSAPILHTKSHLLEMKWELHEPLPYESYFLVLHQLKLALHVDVDIALEYEEIQPSLELLEPYVAWICSTTPSLEPFAYRHPLWQDDQLCFFTGQEEVYQGMLQGKEELEARLAKVGWPIVVSCLFQEAPESTPEMISTSTFTPGVSLETLKEPKVGANSTKKTTSPKSSPGKGSKFKNTATKVPIEELSDGLYNVEIEGHIFAKEIRLMRDGRSKLEICVSDDEEAIACYAFESRTMTKEMMDEVRVGDEVRLIGESKEDTYRHSLTFKIQKFERLYKPKMKDEALEKRIEWHVHSNFSEMDGVSSIESFIQQAWDWDMPAIGLCDHNVVQAFPMAQHKIEALKKKDPNKPFKMLYGCEMTMVSPTFQVVHNARDQRLEEAEYVVFDLETTGLSSRLDKIIEFGAVKVHEGGIVDRKQMFINPKRQLPVTITELTHIQQSDVDAAKPIEEVFDEIKDFIGDAILVAHNAIFDVGMLNAAARALGREEFTNPVIDTLPAAYSMMEMRSYRLGNLCRHYGVPYDGEGAHRADYDAEVLNSAFSHMLREWGRDATLEDLKDLDHSAALRKNHGHHVTVFARNKEGLKELFELITLSHTQYLRYNPKSASATGNPCIPKNVLEEYHQRGNLLIGSSCQNGEIFDLAHTRSEKELLEAASFYDFLEIQPLGVYKHLIDAQTIHSVEELKAILGFILEAGEKQGIPIIASGDCHYVQPRQKRVRDVYINAKNGNMRHPLYFRNAQMRHMYSAPDQAFLTTNQMLDAFDWLEEEIRQAIVIDNPRKLAEQTEELFPVKDRLYPPEMEGSDQKLTDICYETARQMYGDPLPEPVQARLKKELDAIIGAGYYVVYYISHLLVKKSNEDGYLVGSRGSVGSSFVATMSGITEVNPLEPHYLCPHCHHLEWITDGSVHSGFDLPDKPCPICGNPMKGEGQDIPFETFLGFHGDKVPDIDLNFSGEYQANAHAFTKTIFGDDHVFRAGTVGTVQEKTAYGYVKGYEEEMGRASTPFSEWKRQELSMECAGVKRTTGQHPGGIVVVPADMDIHDFSPVQYPANNPYAEWKTTHFDFHQIHDNILKFDILGHVDPTAMKMLERITGIDVKTIPMNDPETMAIFSTCDTLGLDTTRYPQVTGAAGIPEFGTSFVRGILELTKPTTFAELVSISGLSHGTDVWLNNAKDLIDEGICNLRQVIGCRDDIMIDLIRYGLPSKESFTIMESVRKGKGLKPEWESLMQQNHVPNWYIDSCKKIKYMFPKAHAVAYVMMAIRIAWFKVHQPRAYYCQFFSIRCDAYDLAIMTKGLASIQKRMFEITTARADKNRKVEKKELDLYDTLELCQEMYMRGYRFSNLSITKSDATEFRLDPDDDKAIIPPFSAVEALGESVARSIVKAREEKAFMSKEDLLNRTSLTKTLLERLDSLEALEGLDDKNQLSLF